MDENGKTIELISVKIQEMFQGDSRVLAVFLMGSAAGNTMRADSDINLAILPEPGVQRICRNSFLHFDKSCRHWRNLLKESYLCQAGAAYRNPSIPEGHRQNESYSCQPAGLVYSIQFRQKGGS